MTKVKGFTDGQLLHVVKGFTRDRLLKGVEGFMMHRVSRGLGIQEGLTVSK